MGRYIENCVSNLQSHVVSHAGDYVQFTGQDSSKEVCEAGFVPRRKELPVLMQQLG